MGTPLPRKWLFWIAVVLGALVLFYLVGVPSVELLLRQFRPPPPAIRVLEEMSFGEQLRLRAAEGFVAAWIFCFGAMIGSFLNVVVYRLPRGESIVMRGSYCPRCGAPIASRDNLPVIGWLLLGGRCRVCRGPISTRYPIVEFMTASLFLVLYLVQLRSGGANLPTRTPNHYTGVVWIIFDTRWDLVGLYAYHSYLLSTVFAWSLIQGDGERIPRGAVGVTLMLALIPPLAWPPLLLVKLTEPLPEFLATAAWHGSLATAVAGGLAGCVLGQLLHVFQPERRPAERRGAEANPVPGCLLLGLGLGWQAILVIAGLAAGFRGLVAALSRRGPPGQRIPPLAYVLVAALLHHLLWRPIYHSLFG